MDMFAIAHGSRLRGHESIKDLSCRPVSIHFAKKLEATPVVFRAWAQDR